MSSPTSNPVCRFMPDEGTGKKTVWRVEDMELVEVCHIPCRFACKDSHPEGGGG